MGSRLGAELGVRGVGYRHTLTEFDEGTLHKSKTLDRALRSNALFVLLLVLVLSPPRRMVLVLEAI